MLPCCFSEELTIQCRKSVGTINGEDIQKMEDKMMTVSIAAYNVADYLEECLASLASCQNRKLLEVLVIDDGSSDQTAEIAEEFCRRDPDVFRLVKKMNGGWGSTLNTSIPMAKGKYFRQLDGDDKFDTGMLNTFLERLEKDDSDLVLTPHEVFISGTKNYQPAPDTITGKAEREDFRCFPGNAHLPMHACTFRTALLQSEQVHLLEHCFYTDVEFVLQSIREVQTVAIYELPIYRYRLAREGQSVSRAGYQKHRLDLIRVAKSMIDTYQNEDFYNRTAARTRIADHINAIYANLDVFSKVELQDFDTWLKNSGPEFYQMNQLRIVMMLRKTNFGLWHLAVSLTRLLHKAHGEQH